MPENSESEAGGGASESNDSWGRAVNLLTGYPMPARSELFEELTSQHGIPLFDIVGIDHWRVQSTMEAQWGWQTHGFDFVMPFYETAQGNGAHRGVRMRGVNIRFIGTNGRPLLGPGGTLGGAQSSVESDAQWNRTNLAAYITGPTVALDKLLEAPSYSTRHVSFAGRSVSDSAHVSLDSFQRTGMAFDRAALFFQGRADVLAAWERSFGEEESPWRGQAAGVFWDLINIIRRNYDGYVDQLGGRGYSSGRAFLNGHGPLTQIADSLAWAQEALRHGAASLRAAWDHWAADGWHDPYRWVLAEIEEFGNWIIGHNHVHVIQDWDRDEYVHDGQGGAGPGRPSYSEDFDSRYRTTEGFHQDHEYGPLAYPQTWVQVAQAAIAKWNQHVDTTIGLVAGQVMANLSNNWRQAQETAGDRVRNVATETPGQIPNEDALSDLPEELVELFGPDGLGNLPGVDDLLGGGGGGGGLLNPDVSLGDLP
ncbi:AAWKG family protein, partial [Streptomyces sp. PSKA30]|uniref:AAWKG family protein n=1 Tax=Streptomyces sp. PSKA30 TaxID=2874597 RepID=UPI001CD0FE82